MYALPVIDPEIKALIPPLQEDERMQLEQNILAARKCHDAIILWDGIIIDGHNRFEICEKHGIEFEVVDMPLPNREAVKVWILENQLGRRNLSDVARIEIALLKEEMLREKARKKQSLAGGDKSSNKGDGALLFQVSKPKIDSINVREAIAAEAGVCETTLHRYTEIKEQGCPELLEHVRSGELTIRAAHRICEVTKQLKRANKMYRFISETVPLTSTNANRAISSKLAQLSALLDQLLNKLEGGGANDNLPDSGGRISDCVKNQP